MSIARTTPLTAALWGLPRVELAMFDPLTLITNLAVLLGFVLMSSPTVRLTLVRASTSNTRSRFTTWFGIVVVDGEPIGDRREFHGVVLDDPSIGAEPARAGCRGMTSRAHPEASP